MEGLRRVSGFAASFAGADGFEAAGDVRAAAGPADETGYPLRGIVGSGADSGVSATMTCARR